MRRLLKWYRNYRIKRSEKNDIKAYLKNGQIPWTRGYEKFKRNLIHQSLHNKELLADICEGKLPYKYGFRIDERIVELPWLIANLSEGTGNFLDAGSSLNHDYIVSHQRFEEANFSIYTYSPESTNFNERRISYVYGDLRCMPFKDNWFDQIACISTLEHIDMDNSMYGYKIPNHGWSHEKSFEYLKAVKELMRILKPGGKLYITVPFGKFENHGFFQQFDEELVQKMKVVLQNSTDIIEEYFQYLEDGWQISNSEVCRNSISYNPHTNKGKLADFAAHSRAICSLIVTKE